MGYGLGEGELGYGSLGVNDVPRALIQASYNATDVADQLPVGVKVRDRAGNVSAVLETLAQLADVPKGARGLAITSTGNPGEARVSWTASPDV